MSVSVTVAVDANGGDNGSAPILEGVASALAEDKDLNVLLCGKRDDVLSFCNEHERCVPIECGEPIGMGEHPAEAVKSKKDSSIVVGCTLVKEGRAQGFFSAGSTGACLVAATLYIGRIKGVKRPALAIVLPGINQPTLFLDIGANSDCKVDYLVQFASMGAAYMKGVHNVRAPRIGLLNIGEEASKGSMLVQDAYIAMKEQVEGFAGNCEGGDILNGNFDVVVTDGFTGNVCLKTMESTVKFVLKHVKGGLTSSLKAKMGALLVKGTLSDLKTELNPDAFGGSPLLGLKGICVIGHGSSNARAVRNGIFATASAVRSDVCGNIEAMVEAGGAR